jgi:SAM-dependent methyltransferase
MLGNMRRTVERRAGRLIFGSRTWVEAQLADLTTELRSARILEIGSGRQDMGENAYSFRRLFHESNDFVQSDIDASYGHEVVDVTTMEYDSEWDLILCVSVVEHIPDFMAAVQRIHRALTPGGRAVIVAPMCFPYHDEPHDYWRFTVHGVRYMLTDFTSVDVRSRGPARLPFTTLAIARKGSDGGE